jgi:hypothetical protein
MLVISNEERLIREFPSKKSRFVGQPRAGWESWTGSCEPVFEFIKIEEAVVTDRFLLAVAKHR